MWAARGTQTLPCSSPKNSPPISHSHTLETAPLLPGQLDHSFLSNVDTDSTHIYLSTYTHKCNCVYMEGGGIKKRKAPIELDWAALLPRHDDDPPLQLIVATTVDSPEKPRTTPCDDDNAENFANIPDAELEKLIGRNRSHYENMRNTLPDKGQKLLTKLRSFEKEEERRKNLIYKVYLHFRALCYA